jgi:hypothetical protein
VTFSQEFSNLNLWERREMRTNFWSENLEGRQHSEQISVDGKVILKWILGKYGGKVWTGVFWLRIRNTRGFYEESDESLGSTQGEKFLH